MEAKAIAVTHQQGCERAYAENQRRLTSIENKTDAQTVKLDAIQDRAGKRYWATMATAVTLAVTVGWQIFVYLHPHVG